MTLSFLATKAKSKPRYSINTVYLAYTHTPLLPEIRITLQGSEILQKFLP